LDKENKKTDLKKKIFIRFFLLFVVLALILFISAGSVNYWQGWLFCVFLITPMTFTIFYFLKRDPELLERRLKTQEKEKEQKLIVKIGFFLYPLFFIIPGLDYRFGWSNVPVYLVIAGDILFLTGYIIIIFVFKENSYASRVIEVEKAQKVISSGPYAVIRHPMYSAIIIMYTAFPVALGSYWALLISITLPVFFALRILNEEKVLSDNLEGYKEYCIKTKYRLMPHVW